MANPNYTRSTLSKGAKAMVEEKFNYLMRKVRCYVLHQLNLWSCGEMPYILHLGDEQLKFVLNGALDTPPHNANLYLWKKREDDKCPLCGGRQTLVHVLNAFPVSLHKRR